MTETLDYLLRELRTADGGFAASQDADTEGEEGATFVWSAAEVREALGADAALFAAAYGVTDAGNWEGHTILSRVPRRRRAGRAVRAGGREVAGRLAAGRAALLARRMTRPQPARDDKVLAAWNGLAIAALADAARSLAAGGDADHGHRAATYREAAERAATTVLAGLADAGRAAAALVEGRTGHGGRRPGGLREPRRRAARAVRGDLRRALVHRMP